MNGFTDILLAPALPWPLFAVVAGLALLAVAAALARRSRGAWLRGLAFAVLLGALLDPRLVGEHRLPQPDVAVVVVDGTPSQALGERRAQTEAALAELSARLKAEENLEVRVERLGVEAGAALDDGTRLFAAVRRAIADVPPRRLAGVVLITDGQVHDLPTDTAELPRPLHVLLTGRPGEGDRRLIVERAPGFGIVGRTVTVSVRVEDSGPNAQEPRNAEITVRRDGEPPRTLTVPVGRSYALPVEVAHGGANVMEIAAAPGPAELSLANNRAAVSVGGVRDRLRVLLISEKPHAGERTFRNILKSDANVDLVHFTILRQRDKEDFTPLNELALIAFPTRELFEERLADFDLVIFDHYGRDSLVPQEYLANVARYVRAGGAMLLAVGPEFAGLAGLGDTPLRPALPAMPTGRNFEQGFTPALTAVGRRHPVTDALTRAGGPQWGRWFRHIEAGPTSGEVLMSGVDGRPLLVLDRIGQGRAALLLSDTIWLWARGFEGGGPQAELLRRLAHWLMKEPELEEEALKAEVRAGTLAITRRSLTPGPARVGVTSPSGESRDVELAEPTGGGPAQGTLAVAEPGLWRVADDERTAIAAAGALNPPELADLAATDRKLRPAAEATGGGVFWLADQGVPEVRRTRPGAAATGRDWFGLAANRDYLVAGVEEMPLLPPLLALLLALGALAGAWYREGR